MGIFEEFRRKLAGHSQGGRPGGRLRPCPDRPNCVCTETSDLRHRMDPLPLRAGTAETLERLKGLLSALPRTRVVEVDGNYLRAEATSRLGFVDDVEFLVDESARTVHFRSASRLGYSDLGVNRKRMEIIVAAYLRQEAD